jgi:type IV pilus assembly protein PilO
MKFSLQGVLFLVAMVGLLVLSYFVVFQKAAARRLALQADSARKQESLGELERSTAGINDLDRKLGEVQKAVAFFESKLPQAKEIDKILKEVWQMAEANSLQTRTIKTMNSQHAANYSEQPIEISLSGDFNGFYAFLLQLEKLPRLTRVTQMNLQKLPDHDGEMQAQMTLSIFFEPDVKNVNPVQTAAAR